MGQQRTPKGTYVRNTPDWFNGRAGTCFVDVGALGGLFATACVFNNSNTGDSLYVYGIYCYVFDANQFGLYGLTGGQLGSPPATGTNSISGNDPLPPGYGTLTYSPPNVIAWLGAIAGHNQAQDRYLDYPLAIVPPGYSLVLQTNSNSVRLTSSFYWIANP